MIEDSIKRALIWLGLLPEPPKKHDPVEELARLSEGLAELRSAVEALQQKTKQPQRQNEPPSINIV